MNTAAIPSYKEGLKKLEENASKMLSTDVRGVFDTDAQELGREYPFILKLQVGEKAPDFKLLNTSNKCVNLYEVLKSTRVVLTFFRGTWCPYCNLILSQYQAILPEIEKEGATLIAISPQTIDESLNTKQKNKLQFEILSDNGNFVSKGFTSIHQTPKNSLNKMIELGYDYNSYYSDENSELSIPAVYIIEKNGTISFAKTEGGDYRKRVEPIDIINALNIKHTT